MSDKTETQQSTQTPTQPPAANESNSTTTNKPNPNIPPPEYQISTEGFNPYSDLQKIVKKDDK